MPNFNFQGYICISTQDSSFGAKKNWRKKSFRLDFFLWKFFSVTNILNVNFFWQIFFCEKSIFVKKILWQNFFSANSFLQKSFCWIFLLKIFFIKFSCWIFLTVQLEYMQDGPRSLTLKFGKNRVSDSWDIPDIDKCRKDKCCLNKCHCGSWNMFK